MIDGSYGNLIDMFTRNQTGHIQVHGEGYLDKPSIYKIIKDYESTGGRISEVPHVESWTPRVYTPALAFAGTKTSGVQVMGIDTVRETGTTRLREKVTRGRFLASNPSREIIVDERLSRVLKIGLGDQVALIAQGIDGSIANDLFTVVGIAGSKESTYGGSSCYLHIDTAREFLSMRDGAHEIAVVLTDHERTTKTVDRIRQVLHDDSLDVEPWQIVEAQFYRAMQADIKGNWITIIVFTIIIAIGVLNTVLMVILERTREFGVMRAMGTRPLQIFILIVLETSFLSLMSIVLGSVAGIVANWILSVYGITLSSPIDWGGFIFDTITAKITLRSMLLPIAVIVGTAISVSVPPALRAARIKPVKALRAV
jgi:ABC-type lipoprotein release transport system permease subunit